MAASTMLLPCDGCSVPASPEHIAERLRRLELATRFRPVHIGVLFVALAPPARTGDDFYGPPESQEFFDAFLSGLEIADVADTSGAAGDPRAAQAPRLAEFQHRGYFMAYLSECPIPADTQSATSAIARLAPTLIRRIRFNYKPKLVAPIGEELNPLLQALRAAEAVPVLALDQGRALPVPRTGDREWKKLFEWAVAAGGPSDYL